MDSQGKEGTGFRPFFWVAAAVGALFLPALIFGEGVLPLTSLWRYPPWTGVLPALPGNGMLSDQLLFFVPWRAFLSANILAGRFPLWNPLIACGVPFAACVQAAPFFPTNLLLSPLSPAAWSVVASFVHLFTAGAFMIMHTRRLGASREGAALAGVAFALCGFLVAWLGHPHVRSACLLPALFWTLGRASERPEPRRWAGVGLVVGLIMLGGHPPTIVHVLMAGAAYAFFLSRRVLGGFVLAAVAGALLAAPAWLPYLEYLGQSSTAEASRGLARWSTRLPPWALAHFLMPLSSGSPVHGHEALAAAFGLRFEANFIERAGWIGLLPLFLAVRAVARRRSDPEILFHACLAAFGLAAALGVPPLPWIWKLLPGFSSINPTRLLLLFCFGAATLAAVGASEPDASRRESGKWPAFAVLGGVALWGARILAIRAAGGAGVEDTIFSVVQSMLLLGEAAVAAHLTARRGLREMIGIPFVAVCLLRVGLGLNPTAPAGAWYPETPAVTALKSEVGEGRVFALGWALPPDTAMTFGLRDARGRDFTTIRRYEELVRGAAGDFDFYAKADAPPANPALLGVGLLAASAKTKGLVPASWPAVYDGEMAVFRVPGGGRRALFVPAARAGSPAEVLSAVRAPGFDPTKTVWLDDGSAPQLAASPARGNARIVRENSDRVEIEVESTGPGWLVLLDTWYPGWRVTVNGAPAQLRRADYAFRAVAVSGGKSVVSFGYEPRSFTIALELALIGLAALLGATFYKRKT